MQIRNACSVLGCFYSKEEGDMLFCKDHRFHWVSYCKMCGIETVPLPPLETSSHLSNFIQESGRK